MSNFNVTFDCTEEGDKSLADQAQGVSPDYVTTRARSQPECTQFEDRITTMLQGWFNKQDAKLNMMMEEFGAVKTAVNFMSAQYEMLLKRFDSAQGEVKKLEGRVENNEKEISELKFKLEAMEQRSRQCNIEIGNMPEKRNERLYDIVQNIGNAIKYPIASNDIVSVHRVPHGNPQSPHPRNVILKLASQATRDNILAACRLTKVITSEAINIPGDSKRIYFNEHLTLHNKMLFREARQAARTHSYQYVWVKHGAILVRKSDGTASFAIRTAGDLSKIKSD